MEGSTHREHTGQHGRGRLQDDAEDGDGDEQANDGIGKRKTEPDTGGTQDDSEAREAVCACMIAVGNQGRAVDLAPARMRNTATLSLPMKPMKPAMATHISSVIGWG